MTSEINKEMPQQYLLCSLLYSVLDGNEAMERENACLFAALKIHEIQRTGKSVQEKDIPQSSPAQTPLVHKETKYKLKNFKEKPYLYKRETALEYLRSHDIEVPQNIEYPEDFQEIIIRDLSHATNSIHHGDKERALLFLKKAKKEWLNRK